MSGSTHPLVIAVTEEEAQRLQTLITDPQTPEHLVVRAWIILTAWAIFHRPSDLSRL